ncbi:MAG: GNAT family N-acetyltransferase, partial [bacterium]
MKLYDSVETQSKMSSVFHWRLRFNLNKMSAMEVVALPGASVDHLGELFQEEERQWQRQLSWDYGPTLQLVKKLLSSGALPGFLLMDGREAVGYTYFVYDRPVGFIGGLYVLDSFADAASYNPLIEKTVNTMCGLKNIARIESQVMPLNFEFAGKFAKLGFKVSPRYFLSASLSSSSVANAVQAQEGIDDFKIWSWRPELMVSAVEVIYDSYVASPDVGLCRDYQSRVGCKRFLKNLIDSPTCGSFCQKTTRVAMDKNGRLCGILLATRINSETGMIPQLSVRRDCQGKGVGSSLLAEYIKAAAAENLERVSLSVLAWNGSHGSNR